MDFDSNDFQAFVSSRRSTRDFLSTPVPDEIIQQIIADGLTSPSWSNTRPIRVAVAKGDVRDRLSKEFLSRWEAIKGARSGIFGKIKAVLKRKGLPTSNWIVTRPYHKDLIVRSKNQGKEFFSFIGVDRDDKKARDQSWARNYEFFGAPVELFIFTHKSLGKYSASDAGLFMQNLILSAHSKVFVRILNKTQSKHKYYTITTRRKKVSTTSIYFDAAGFDAFSSSNCFKRKLNSSRISRTVSNPTFSYTLFPLTKIFTVGIFVTFCDLMKS